MAVSYTEQKYNVVSRLETICTQILDLMTEAKELRQEAIDNGFQPGGANAVTENELNGAGGRFPHLAVADLTAAFTAIQNIDTQLAASTRADYKALARLRR